MQVDVSPDMAMYKLLTRQGYDPSFALAEFVDNAIDAHLKQKPPRGKRGKRLDITLKFFSEKYADPTRRNSIVIEDNGPGITETRLHDAFKPAKVSAATGLSEFGIGMKAAAVWFADIWTLHTIPISGSSQFETRFDLTSLLEKGESKIDVIETTREKSSSGTVLSLLSLRRAVTKELYDVICKDLIEVYQRFTEGDSAPVNLMAKFDETTSDLNYVLPSDRATLIAERYETRSGKTYVVGKKRNWTVPLHFVFEGKVVTGFISLLEIGSYKSNPGLVLFRNDRVIMGTSRKPYIPVDLIGTSNKYGRQRVYGELNIDGLPVTYTKDRFEVDEAAFVASISAEPGVEELVKQSDKYRTTLKPGTFVKISERAFISKPTAVKKKPKLGVSSGVTTPQAPSVTSGAAAPPTTAAPATHDLSSFLKQLRAKTPSLALQAIIDESIFQISRKRPIAAALCLRIVLEAGVLERIRVTYPLSYPAVSGKAIAALVTYIQGNMTTFLDANADYKVIKCIQNNAIKGQGDVMALNNIAHGNYAPSMHEVERFVANLEPLLFWAYG